MQPQRKEDERDRRRRINDEATQPYFVPGYQGHWSAAILFAASLIGAAILWSCLPTARAIIAGDGPDSRTATTFWVLYAAMAIGPLVGWILWGGRRRWAAMAVVALFFVCVAWIRPAIPL